MGATVGVGVTSAVMLGVAVCEAVSLLAALALALMLVESEPLRLADSANRSDTPAESAEELPAFLADGEGQDAVTDEAEPTAIAAE